MKVVPPFLPSLRGIVFAGLVVATAAAQEESSLEFSTRAPVGPAGTNRFYTPANQIITPAGLQVELPGLRPQAIALSPNGNLLVTSGKTHDLVVVDPATGKVRQRVPLPSDETLPPAHKPVSQNIISPDKADQLSFTGLAFSPDGSRIYLANVDGSIKVFSVGASNVVQGAYAIPLPGAAAPRRSAEIPAGLAVSPDGKRLYVAFNLSNRLAELDALSGAVLRTWDVGVAPYDVVLAGRKVYVSNWGGRRPADGSVTGPAGQGTRVRVDPVRFIASEGSVSVIDLSAAATNGTEIITGLHACALALSPNGRWLVVANAGSDQLSVIDTKLDTIVERVCARKDPSDLFGAQPNALAFDKSGKCLFVCNGSQNAVAVFGFKPNQTELLGLLPVGWFPGGIAYDPRRNSIYVANIKGTTVTKALSDRGRNNNTHQYHGSLSLVKVPTPAELAAQTRAVLANMRYPLLKNAARPPRPRPPARPVPERVGEPSVFDHVIYVIKENRTYDQVLGDMKEGNGDASLCIFGENVTPNQHKLAREFVLLDNTYCSGIQSADGHQWTDTGISTEYAERSFAGFPRSYFDGMGESEVDALAYSPAGFIWDNAILHGKTLRDYGEFAFTRARWKDPARKGSPSFLDYYRDFTGQRGEILIHSTPGIESLRPYLATNTVGWDLNIPDVFRAAQFIRDLRDFEKRGEFPHLSIICLPNDHTSGTRAHSPTPAAQVADNDLALGQIVEAVSHSRFWTNTCIFVIEDDPQSGWDHVSGFRTTAFVVSPYTRHGATVSTQYNHTSLLRTMELILGLPPMNQLDATATPMSDCFAPSPDFTAFTAVTNNIPLDQMNPEPKKVSDRLLRKDAYASARLRLDLPDRCPEDLLNRILWRAMKGPAAPYPAWAVTAVKDDD